MYKRESVNIIFLLPLPSRGLPFAAGRKMPFGGPVIRKNRQAAKAACLLYTGLIARVPRSHEMHT